jgi:hypothetical protein
MEKLVVFPAKAKNRRNRPLFADFDGSGPCGTRHALEGNRRTATEALPSNGKANNRQTKTNV